MATKAEGDAAQINKGVAPHHQAGSKKHFTEAEFAERKQEVE